jgi:TRAP-type C4-dicarboxylate transport system substrate-binding protein
MRTAALLAVPALMLAGCSKADRDAAGGEGEGVPVGATAEEYQAALGDMEPVELTYQVSASSAESSSGQREEAFADAVEEMSGGAITLDIVYGNAVVPPDEISSALADGRLDLAHWLTSYHADEMKAFTNLQDALVSVETSPLQGEIVSHFTAQEVAFNTPEIMEEFDAHGMTVLNPYNTFGSTALACTSEKGSPADFDGDQIRANAAAQSQQIDALGGSTVTLQLAETYEGLQRNVLQCTFGSPTSMVMSGWLETAGNVYMPKDSSFVSGPGSIVAGSSWDGLPLAAQQLIYDQIVAYNTGELGNAFVSAIAAAQASTESGGSGMHFLDSESEEALKAGNQRILDAVAESENLDGQQLLTDVEESAAKWADIAEELGYTDEGDYLDFADWYAGNGDVMDPEYVGPIVDRFYEEVLAEHRPA